MESTGGASTSRGRVILRWAGRIAFWALLVLEVLAMGSAGLAKFLGMDGWMYWFARFGYPPRFALVVGAVEFAGAGILLLPRWSSYAAIVLCVVMLGALHAVLTHDTDLGWAAPLIHMAFLVPIGVVRWKKRWRWGGGVGHHGA